MHLLECPRLSNMIDFIQNYKVMTHIHHPLSERLPESLFNEVCLEECQNFDPMIKNVKSKQGIIPLSMYPRL